MENEITRDERISNLQAEYDRRKDRAEEFSRQHNQLVVGLQQMDKIKSQEIEKVLDSLPEMSPKGVVDQVLKLPDEKRGQLLGNIQKLKIAIVNEQRKMKQLADQVKAERQAELDEIADQAAREAYRMFFEWIEKYKAVRSYYWDELIPCIQNAWQRDRQFPERPGVCEGNRNAIPSIISHFRDSEYGSMEDTISKILFMSDVQNFGEPLLTKADSGGWPENPEGEFYKQSKRTDSNY